MPGTTSNYGLPYQTSGDAPNGPVLGQQLAEAVDALLTAKQPLIGTAALASAYTFTGSMSDMPGASVTLSVPRSGAKALIYWATDFQLQSTGSVTAYTLIAINGVEQPQNAVWNPANVAAGARCTVGNSFTTTLGGVGSYTFKMRGTGSALAKALNIHTQVSVLVFP